MSSGESEKPKSSVNRASDEWYDEASRGVQPAKFKSKLVDSVRKERKSKDERKSKHQKYQLTLAVSLIILYGLGIAALFVGWFLGHDDLSVVSAVIGNIGTLVGAVVAFYFANKK